MTGETIRDLLEPVIGKSGAIYLAVSEPGDRHPAVPVPVHRPVPPGQGLHQARHHLAQPAPPHPARYRGHCPAALTPICTKQIGPSPGRAYPPRVMAARAQRT